MLKFISLSACVIILLYAAIAFTGMGNSGGIAAVIGSQKKLVYAECITTFSDEPLTSFTLHEVDLDNDQIFDVLVQHTDSNREACGTAGCVYEICVHDKNGTYVHIPFGFAAHSISAQHTTNNGMKDIILNEDPDLRMTWNGSRYTLDSH